MNSRYDIIRHKSLGGFYGLHEVFHVGNKQIPDEKPIVVGDTPEEILHSLKTMMRDATESCTKHLDGHKCRDVE